MPEPANITLIFSKVFIAGGFISSFNSSLGSFVTVVNGFLLARFF